jgi:hypothetical protein
LAGWDNVFQDMIKTYQNVSDASVCGLAVVAKEDSGKSVESVMISDNAIIRRKALSQKNAQLSHFSYSYVSSEDISMNSK